MKTRIVIISIIVMLFCISCHPAVIVEIENSSEESIETQYFIKNEFFINIEGAEQEVNRILESGEIMKVNCSWGNNTLSFEGYDRIAFYSPLFDYFSVTFLHKNRTISMNDEDYFNITYRKEGLAAHFFTIQIVGPEVSKK